LKKPKNNSKSVEPPLPKTKTSWKQRYLNLKKRYQDSDKPSKNLVLILLTIIAILLLLTLQVAVQWGSLTEVIIVLLMAGAIVTMAKKKRLHSWLL